MSFTIRSLFTTKGQLTTPIPAVPVVSPAGGSISALFAQVTPPPPPAPPSKVSLVCFSGSFTNPATTASGTRVFANWGDTTPTTHGHALAIPYNCFLKAFTVAWGDKTPISIASTEQIEFTVGKIPFNVIPDETTYIPYASTSVVWNNTNADNTWPQTQITEINELVLAGDKITVSSLETGTVTPTTGDVIVTVWLEAYYT